MMKNITLLFIVAIFSVGIFLSQHKEVYAYGECSEYGLMVTYDSFRDTCECMSGYVMGKDVIGRTACVSADSMCRDKYGFGSRFDSLSDTCECSYGYILGKDSIGRTQCISESTYCNNQLGFSSRYNSLSDQCECLSGYVMSGGKCTDGNGVCRVKQGIYSSYSSLYNKCECDSGYTLDETDQCVKKQNNVYFSLQELDTENRQAIVKSDYDYRYYLVSYGIGCYDFSFKRYLNQRIVVNLGTDYSLDMFDKIVLQDDSETCDITHIAYADSSTTLEPEEEETDENTFFFNQDTAETKPMRRIFLDDTDEKEAVNDEENQDIQSGSDVSTADNNEEQLKEGEIKDGASWYEKIKDFLAGLFR